MFWLVWKHNESLPVTKQIRMWLDSFQCFYSFKSQNHLKLNLDAFFSCNLKVNKNTMNYLVNLCNFDHFLFVTKSCNATILTPFEHPTLLFFMEKKFLYSQKLSLYLLSVFGHCPSVASLKCFTNNYYCYFFIWADSLCLNTQQIDRFAAVSLSVVPQEALHMVLKYKSVVFKRYIFLNSFQAFLFLRFAPFYEIPVFVLVAFSFHGCPG